MKSLIDYENGITNIGNWKRIGNVMKRAMEGDTLTIGFIGGSITMGSVATTPERCYAYHVYEWWKHAFPKAKLRYVNAGIGATDSQFGCARVQADLLSKKPDFVIVEFSVNDSGTEHYMETYEGLIRLIYGDDNAPAVLVVHNVCYDTGANAQLVHAKVVRHYDLPSVSMQSSIYPALLSGKIQNREITPDDLHPNDKGHELVASVITYYLEKMLKSVEAGETVGLTKEETMPNPLTKNAYETSVRYQNNNCIPIQCEGFEADNTKQNNICEIFRNGWTAKGKGAKISFKVKGSCLALQYRRTISLPAPIAKMVVDKEEENAILLDANFDETWGDKMELTTLLEHGEDKVHTIEVTITETHDNDQLPFYLVSVIGA